ncbi:MAG TPA: proton-conducting transporter membrane subunit [Vicinamibacterales bacterium]|nr:proton-conducting transporter membrane subunit [Vicinamibacterales bacterium]
MTLDPGFVFPAALVLRAVVCAVTVAAYRRIDGARTLAFLGSAAASALTGLAGAVVLLTAPVHGEWLVHRASGFVLGYTLDALSAWFLVVLALLAVPIAVFSVAYAGHGLLRQRSVFLGLGFNVLIAAVELVFVSDGVIAFLCAWELMTLATAALVATEHEDRANRRAAYLYLVMSHVGTGCLVAAFLTLASTAGSLSFGPMLAGAVVSGPMRDGVFALFLLGFGVKAGVIPMHVWLPEAHPAAPSSISALMSAVLIKTGIYGIVRVCAFGLGTPSLPWGIVIMVLGGISAVLGVLYALMQHDLKRLLAYHSIENIGIILLGLGAGMIALAYGRQDLAAVGVAASLYHVLNHAVFKGLLFLGAGGIVMATGTRQIEQCGGLLRRMPWTGLYFLIGAMAISGLPPLNGFASEWLTFQSFLYGFRALPEPLVHLLFPVGGALLALTTALAAACFVKAFGIVFLALPRSPEAADAAESPVMMLAPQAWLAVLCVGLGLFPGFVVRVLGVVLTSLPGVGSPDGMSPSLLSLATGRGGFDQVVPVVLAASVVVVLGLVAIAARVRRPARRVPTWGCGGELTARTEYTATAFSKPIMMIFRAVYRPTRHVDALADVSPYFPQEVRYHAEIEPTFERFVYEPLERAVIRVARGMRMMQAGSLHAYLAYVIALVVGLVLFVWWTG